MNYFFAPMMGFYSRLMAAPVEWIESKEGRKLIARILRLCRSKHGRPEAIRFRDALIYVGIYPCWPLSIDDDARGDENWQPGHEGKATV